MPRAMNHLAPWLAAATVAILAAGCWNLAAKRAPTPGTSAMPGTDQRPEPTTEELALDVARRQHATGGLDALGFEVFAAIASASPTVNLALSPASLGRALLMAYFGAQGSTKDELATALGMPDQTDTTVGDWVDATGPSLKPDGVDIEVADSAWIQAGFSVLPGFTSALQSHFGAAVGAFTDSTDGSQKIGAWIAQATKGLLDSYQMPVGTRVDLVDALYFKSRWDQVFDPSLTQDRPFYASSTETIQVPTMDQSGRYSYAETDGYQVIKLPYQNSVYAMYILEASDSVSVPTPLDAPTFASLAAALSEQPGEILLPRFSFSENQDLTGPLKAAGLAPVFTSGADFSGIAPGLFIGDVQQQDHVAVDETGTVAAAATEIGMMGAAEPAATPPFRMDVDRPFTFVIRDDSTGGVLFVGHIADPLL